MTASEYDAPPTAEPRPGPDGAAGDPPRAAENRPGASADEPAVLPTVLAECRRALTEAGLATPAADAELLAAHVLGVSRGRVAAMAVTDAPLTSADAARLRELTARRAAREPLQHLTGTAPFRTLELAVGPGVFVPRPETELVAQLAIDALRTAPGGSPLAVDLGTGSGAIAIAMAVEVPSARVVAVERSAEAFAWARRNAEAAGAPGLRLVPGDLAEEPAGLEGTVDVVVSNPPYVPEDEPPADPEVRLHDPAEALYGGPDGLEVIRVIAARAAVLVRPGGTVVIEHTEEQGAAVRALLVAHGWRRAVTHRDLTGRDRATTAVR